jgi:hypothetical protein
MNHLITCWPFGRLVSGFLNRDSEQDPSYLYRCKRITDDGRVGSPVIDVESASLSSHEILRGLDGNRHLGHGSLQPEVVAMNNTEINSWRVTGRGVQFLVHRSWCPDFSGEWFFRVFVGCRFQRTIHAPATMLRWTCRLRDVLEQRAFLVKNDGQSRRLSEMREAEFVSPDGNFPAEFRWESLNECFYKPAHRAYLYNSGNVGNYTNIFRAVDPHCSVSVSIRSVSGQSVENLQQENIDVLWLSPSIFISSFEFFVGVRERSLLDYSVICNDERSNRGDVLLRATALGSFEGDEKGGPSPLPLDFFHHVTTLLPAGYFDKIGLQRKHPHRCPVDIITRFLSIVPTHAAPIRAAIYGESTITRGELQHILSYQFHPAMKLIFDIFSMDESVSLTILSDLLKDARYRRAVEMPMDLVEDFAPWDLSGRPFCEEITLKSPDLQIRISQACVLPKCLHAISARHNPYEVTLNISDCHETELLDLVHPYMTQYTSIENLFVRCRHHEPWRDVDSASWVGQTVEEYYCSVADVMPMCRSSNLCTFNVSIVTKRGHETLQCNRVPRWDNDIFPSLTLNYYRKRLTNPTGVVIPLAIRAVNQGIVYSKTTDHIPFNPRMANASLLFRMVKRQAQSQLVDVRRS